MPKASVWDKRLPTRYAVVLTGPRGVGWHTIFRIEWFKSINDHLRHDKLKKMKMKQISLYRTGGENYVDALEGSDETVGWRMVKGYVDVD